MFTAAVPSWLLTCEQTQEADFHHWRSDIHCLLLEPVHKSISKDWKKNKKQNTRIIFMNDRSRLTLRSALMKLSLRCLSLSSPKRGRFQTRWAWQVQHGREGMVSVCLLRRIKHRQLTGSLRAGLSDQVSPWQLKTLCCHWAVLPGRLQTVPQTVVVMADSQTELVSFFHRFLLRQEIHTLHPVVPPLKNTPACWQRCSTDSTDGDITTQLTGAICGCWYVQLGAIVHTILPLGSMSRSHQDRTTWARPPDRATNWDEKEWKALLTGLLKSTLWWKTMRYKWK